MDLNDILRRYPQWATEDTLRRMLMATSQDNSIIEKELRRIAQELEETEDVSQEADISIKQASKLLKSAADSSKNLLSTMGNASDPLRASFDMFKILAPAGAAVGSQVEGATDAIKIAAAQISSRGLLGGALKLGARGLEVAGDFAEKITALAANPATLAGLSVAIAAINQATKDTRAIIDSGAMNSDLRKYTALKNTSVSLGMSITEFLQSTDPLSTALAVSADGDLIDARKAYGDFIRTSYDNPEINKFGLSLDKYASVLISSSKAQADVLNMDILDAEQKKRALKSTEMIIGITTGMAAVLGKNRNAMLDEIMAAKEDGDLNTALLLSSASIIEKYGEQGVDNIKTNASVVSVYLKNTFGPLADGLIKAMNRDLSNYNKGVPGIADDMDQATIAQLELLGQQSPLLKESVVELLSSVRDGSSLSPERSNELVAQIARESKKLNLRPVPLGISDTFDTANKVNAALYMSGNKMIDDAGTHIDIFNAKYNEAAQNQTSAIKALDNASIGLAEGQYALVPGFDKLSIVSSGLNAVFLGTMGALTNMLSIDAIETAETKRAQINRQIHRAKSIEENEKKIEELNARNTDSMNDRQKAEINARIKERIKFRTRLNAQLSEDEKDELEKKGAPLKVEVNQDNKEQLFVTFKDHVEVQHPRTDTTVTYTRDEWDKKLETEHKSRETEQKRVAEEQARWERNRSAPKVDNTTEPESGSVTEPEIETPLSTAPAIAPPVVSGRDPLIRAFMPLLDEIGSGEGGYESSYKFTQGNDIYGSTHNTTRNGKPLTQLTIGEIKELQGKPKTDFARLGAVGKYQMIESTFAETVQKLGISDDAVFSPELQDAMAISLVMEKRPRIGAYLTGQKYNGNEITAEEAAHRLAMEWASFPAIFAGTVEDKNGVSRNIVPGESYYGGPNTSSHSVSESVELMRTMKKRMDEADIDSKDDYLEFMRKLSETQHAINGSLNRTAAYIEHNNTTTTLLG